MSKKNNRGIKARQRKFDIEREQRMEEARKEKQEKRQQTAGTFKLKVKKKGIKLRKNMKIRGIRIEDAESRKAALELLLQERLNKTMDVDADAAGAGAAAEGASGSSSSKSRRKAVGSLKKKRIVKRAEKSARVKAAAAEVVASLAGVGAGTAGAGAGAGPAAMET